MVIHRLVASLLLLFRLVLTDSSNFTELIKEDGHLHHHVNGTSSLLLKAISACQSDPCVHGMCVDHANSTYSCFCEDGYTGYHCQTNWNECWNAPCRHGGTCVDGIGRYHCLCKQGFTGNECEVNIDECQSDPCQNGATCQDGENGYRCRCPLGYEGQFCQIDISVCRHAPSNANATVSINHDALPPTCHNGGRCIDGPGLDYHCECPPGWTGKNCETDVDECCSDPCQNGGRCVDLIGSYHCACVHGFTGKNCESALERCNDSVCAHKGICWLEDGHPVCYCVPDYHGEACELRYNECLLPGTKCLNGGQCVDQVDGYSCSCPPEWTGPRCQHRNNLTTTTPVTTTALTTTQPTTVNPFINCPPNKTDQPNDSTTTDPPSGRDDDPITTVVDDFTTTEFASTTDMTTLKPPIEPDDQLLTTTTTEMPITTTEDDSTTIETTTRRRRTKLTTGLPIEPDYTMVETEPSSEASEISTDYGEIETLQTTLTVVPTTRVARVTTSARLVPRLTTTAPAMTTPEAGMCTSDVCRNGGTCVMTQDGWQCRCSWRHEGRRCERERKLKIPQFTGNSYLTYAVPERALDENDPRQQQQVVEARLEFSTTSPLGLISYVHSADAHVYLAVYVERSVLKFRLSCGKQQMTLVETKYNVSDGAIHNIFMRLVKVEDRNSTNSYCMGSVRLNNSYSMNGEQRLADNQHFSWPWRLHIGGKPSGTPTPTEIIFLPGMVGCAFSLEIDGQKADMISDAVLGKAIDDCPDLRTQLCGGMRCLNGGACNHNETTGEHRCVCPLGWAGDHCEVRQCPCNPCQGNGSVCLMGLNEQMICICPFGRAGSLCELAINVTRPQFDGTLMGHSSYVGLSPPPFYRDHFELKFHFVTDDARQVALLFFIGQPVGVEEKDFLAVSFIRGHVALTWDLGSGARRIFTARPVAVSTMGGHSVHVGRRGRVAWLQVNNQPTVTGRSPGLNSALNANPQLFLGGHSSFNHSQLPSDLPLHSGFRGCIYDVVFRSRDQEANSHFVPIVESGLGVRQCSIPSCRLRAGKEPSTNGDDATVSNYEDDNEPFIDDDC